MIKINKLILLTIFFFVFAFQPLLAITYLYANGGIDPWTASGKTGIQANANLSVTLNALAANEVVWMAAGTYNTTAAITLNIGIQIYGGFVGTENAATDRQLQDETGGNSVIEPWEFKYPTSITGSGSTSVAYTMFSLTNVVTLDGLTIGSHKTTNANGGGIYTIAQATINRCTIQNITGGTNGGGIYSNVAGGAYVNSCLIQNNSATASGGGVYSAYKVTVQQCVIRNNYATTAGAAIYLFTNVDASNTTYILNNVIYNNQANSQGGGIQAGGAADTAPMIICNNTIVNNKTNAATLLYAAGISGIRVASCKYYNNIVYNNYCTTTVTNMRSSDGTGSTVNLQYSAYNSAASLLNGAWASTGNVNNLSAPNFVAPTNTIGYNAGSVTAEQKLANFALSSTSTVLIDKGLAFYGVTPTNDLFGYGRPNGSNYDIGAYEYYTALTIPSPISLSFSSVALNSFKVSFSTPLLTTPVGYIVLRRASTAVTGTPIAGNVYTLGQTNIGSGTNEVIYVGTTPWNNYDQTGLIDNTNYYYAVYSYSGSGASTVYSGGLTGSQRTLAISPAPTASSSSDILSNGFTANWSAVSGATGYKLDVNTTSSMPFTEDFQYFLLGNTSGSDGTNIASSLNSYTHLTGWTGSNLFQTGGSVRMATNSVVGNLCTPTIDLSANSGNATLTFDVMGYTPDVNSVYQILLSTDGGTNFTQIGSNLTVGSNSVFSNQNISITGGTANSKIKVLTVNAATGRIILDNIRIYQVDNLSGYNNLNVNTTNKVVTGLTPNTNYYYRVRAVGANSSSVSSSTIAVTTLPAAPTSTAPTSITASGFTANWTSPTQGGAAFTYLVVYGTVSDLSSGVSTVSVSSSNLSNAITGLSPNTTYYYQIKAVNSSGSGDFSAIQTVRTNAEVTTDVNVSSLTLPASSVINVVSGGNLIINQPTSAYSITVAPGAKVTMNSNYTLSATNGITLQSDETGTATLVDNNTTNPQSVTATVQQYVTEGRNWYMSIPLSTTASSVLNKGTSVVYYKESTGEWLAPELNTLNKLQGYIQTATTTPLTGTTGTVEFYGALNTGAHSINTLTRSVGKTGFNLVGNPYPSYLDWNLVTKTNVSNTMWYRTKVGSVYKFYTYNTVDGAGGIGVPASVTNKIPPMQAFWVRVVNEGTGSIAVNNNMRSHKDDAGNIMRAPKQNSQKLLRLQVSNGTNNDETVVYFNEEASNGFDNYDAPKRSNENPSIPEIFTQVGTEKLVINGLNELIYNTEIPLGFTTGQVNDFSISNTEMTNFEVGTRIMLKDKLLNTETELGEGVVYNFSSQPTAPTTDRFSLLFRAPSLSTGLESSENHNAQVFVNAANQITIVASEKSDYAIFNALGQKVKEGLTASDRTSINNMFESGMYVVTVTKNGKSFSTRVVLNGKW